MLTRSVFATVLLVTGFVAAGCGSSSDKSSTAFGCSDLCAEINTCPSTTTPLACTTLCADVATANSKGNCGSSFDTMMTCVGQHKSEICGIQSGSTQFSCTADSLGYYTCAKTYCNANTTDPGCQALHNFLPLYF